jgi:hypothetical protein
MAALQCVGSALPTPVSLELASSKVREHVCWRMAPFRRSAAEMRANLRQQPCLDDDDGGEEEGESLAALQKKRASHSRGSHSRGSQLQLEEQASPKKSPGPNAGGSSPQLDMEPAKVPVRHRSKSKSWTTGWAAQPEWQMHMPTQRSFVKVSKFLTSSPDDSTQSLLERVDKYYHSASQALAKDQHLLANKQKLTRNEFKLR